MICNILDTVFKNSPAPAAGRGRRKDGGYGVAERMKQKTTLSFEVFPPKTEAGMEKLRGVLEELYRWRPDWISCTYGSRRHGQGL